MSKVLRAWYLFLGLAVLTFVLTAFAGQVPYALTSVVANPVELPARVAANVRGFAVGITERQDLRAENETLATQVAQLEATKRSLELENERLNLLLGVRQTQSPGANITAPVTGLSPGALIKEFSLGRGSRGGVRVDMPVTTPAGLVGLVTEVLPGSSRARAITDPQSRVGVSVRGRGGQGIAVGVPGGQLKVTNFIEEEPVEVGDLLETSSRGGFFPRGVTVARVTKAPERNPNDLRVEFEAEPVVDTSTLLEVVLIEPQ